jgi:diguanylate cyclase (GGDEF)-like protein
MKITPDPRTRLRLRTTGLAALDYGLNVLILCGFAAAGSVPYEVPLRSLAAAVPFNLMFLGGISSGLTQRFRDPSITGIQVFAACGINLLGLLLAPQIAYMFIVNLFVPLSFGGLHFSRRQFFVAWLLASVSLGATLWIVRPRVGIALSSPAEQFLLWAVLTLAFGRFLAINAEVSRLRVRLQEKNRDLAGATTRLSELATRDELTGAWNRREFMRMLEDQRKHAERSGVGFCLAMTDVDRFKEVNDRFGHLLGDAVLRDLAALLAGELRAADRLGRYGGEEFALLLVVPSAGAASNALERMRHSVEGFDWDRHAAGMRVTISAFRRPEKALPRPSRCC